MITNYTNHTKRGFHPLLVPTAAAGWFPLLAKRDASHYDFEREQWAVAHPGSRRQSR